MITAERLRQCDSMESLFALMRELGYGVQPVAIVAEEWRRAGIDIAWDMPLFLAVRVDQLDCYVLEGDPAPEAAQRFLRSLQSYNVITKAVLVCRTADHLRVFDLSTRRELRRLDVDLSAPSPHAIDRLNLLVAAQGDAARLFDRALDSELLARQFFERFRTAVSDVGAALRESFPSEGRDAISAEALLILSRLLFLYFIQQKGWLNRERRFLVDRLEAAVRQRREFFSTVLLPLFFGCLNTPVRERDSAARRLGNLPYLNGGLFEPSAFEKRHDDIRIPNELMQHTIDEVFERFAFSIDESDPAGTYINPEMLGKVFESLMAADERAASGSFYTPKAIVDVLTSRAVRQWVGEITPDTARAALERLQRITVLDPACGSGAFLLSALHIIEDLTHAAAAAAGIEVPGDLRQSIVERSLFGVDLKPEAVRLCELRLWLAIVSRTEGPNEAVQPLPNLDRNVLQGNSLLSPTDFLGDGRGDVYRQWVCALRSQADLVARYRNAPQRERPALARLIRSADQKLAVELLAKSIDSDERELHELSLPQPDLFGDLRVSNLARSRALQQRVADHRRVLERLEEGELDFFSFDIHFAPVMAGGGFDVVVGNPPWVRNSRIDARTKRMCADRYRLFRGSRSGNGAAFHQPDLAIVFFERSISLARPHGAVSLLMPAKVMNAAYAAPLRRAAETLDIVALHDWSDEPRRYFDADTFPLGITVARQPAGRSVEVSVGDSSFELPQHALSITGSEWSLIPPEVRDVIARLYREHSPLREVLARSAVMGVKSGDNGAFFLDVSRVNAGSVETTDGIRIPLRAVCRCVRGRDVRAGEVRGASWMLWPPAGGWERIPRWLERLAESRGVTPDDLQLAYVRAAHIGTKVIWKDVSRGIGAAVLRKSIRMDGRVVALIPNQTLYVLEANSLEEAAVLAALLNSTIVNALAVVIAERAKDFHYRYFGRTIGRIPMPRIERGGSFWSRLLCSSGEEADQVVAELYGVTTSEHLRLHHFVQQRLGYVIHDD
ncbi:MAG: hypothetical protein DMF57_05175 [Acidobacteria bacterium]|nr:MAG: hypothetical protein DMF57_05175 [Acidobacteriota bacterium]